METSPAAKLFPAVALLTEGVDRNKIEFDVSMVCIASPSSRRAWIEIPGYQSVIHLFPPVALLTEGVDRNLLLFWIIDHRATVALLTEGVDRNRAVPTVSVLPITSPSSRRAWIEITTWEVATKAFVVALLTEGVDRNPPAGGVPRAPPRRPPHGGRG